MKLCRPSYDHLGLQHLFVTWYWTKYNVYLLVDSTVPKEHTFFIISPERCFIISGFKGLRCIKYIMEHSVCWRCSKFAYERSVAGSCKLLNTWKVGNFLSSQSIINFSWRKTLHRNVINASSSIPAMTKIISQNTEVVSKKIFLLDSEYIRKFFVAFFNWF